MNALKDARAEKLTQLNSSLTLAERIKRLENPSSRTITRRLQALKGAYSDYLNSHIRYAARLVDDAIFFTAQEDHTAITERYDATMDYVEEMEERALIINNPVLDAAAQVAMDDALQRVEAALNVTRHQSIEPEAIYEVEASADIVRSHDTGNNDAYKSYVKEPIPFFNQPANLNQDDKFRTTLTGVNRMFYSPQHRSQRPENQESKEFALPEKCSKRIIPGVDDEDGKYAATFHMVSLSFKKDLGPVTLAVLPDDCSHAGRFMVEAFRSGDTYIKWKERMQSLTGDIALFGWEEKLRKDHYHSCRVVRVELDQTSLARTTIVEFRPTTDRSCLTTIRVLSEGELPFNTWC